MYDYIIITHLPVFYKINLYNEMAKKSNIFVIFISSDTNEKRSVDFNQVDNIKFKYEIINECEFQVRNKILSCYRLINFLLKTNYKKLLVGGWDLPEFWIATLFSRKIKNCLALESTEIESSARGIKGIIKKIFLAKISTVFASGKMHVSLLHSLNYRHSIIVTEGVGIINKTEYKSLTSQNYTRSFLFIGRLTKVKNLELIIMLFNKLASYTLTIVGTGEEEAFLKSIASDNIRFLGSVKNSDLVSVFQANDFLILPSTSEPWGLVIEEAIYYGLPVILSKNCGSKDLINNGINGFIFDPCNIVELENILLSINDDLYRLISGNISSKLISSKDVNQVGQYLKCVK